MKKGEEEERRRRRDWERRGKASQAGGVGWREERERWGGNDVCGGAPFFTGCSEGVRRAANGSSAAAVAASSLDQALSIEPESTGPAIAI